ncbi:hypothetical protein NEAUS04_2171 [Nematocida ausubeli]|nr:hypothetical protein NEAUS04_1935 [Nematocida ausubeli]KAI5164391.1 hypothetical protein NEAUS04_2171 [Nematocida ausubeli]
MPSSVYVRRIQELLGEICEISLFLMPPQEISLHPCDWLEEDMKHLVLEIEEIKRRLLLETEEKRSEINLMAERKKELISALGEMEEEKEGIWISERNLHVKASLLQKELLGLSVRYEEQVKEFSEVADAIRIKMEELDEYIQDTDACTEILSVKVVKKTTIIEGKRLLSRLVQRQDEIKAETQRKIESTKEMLFKLGISLSESTGENLLVDLSNLEEHLDLISCEVQSYNYTVNKIEITPENSVSNGTPLKDAKNILSEGRCKVPQVTVNLKGINEIFSDPSVINNPFMCKYKIKMKSEEIEIFSSLNDLSFSAAKKIEMKVSRISQTAQELYALLEMRLGFLSNKVEISKTEIPQDISVIERIFVLKKWIEQIEQEYKQRIHDIFTQKKEEFQVVIKKLLEIKKKDTPRALHPDTITDLRFTQQEQILNSLEEEIAAAESEYEILRNIQAFAQERRELLLKMSAFEEQASDPLRLFRSSFQLNSEEKFRKMAVPTLLRVEKEIFALAEQYAEKFSNKPIVIEEKEIISELKDEISNRIINANTFMKGRTTKTNR